MKPIFAAAFLLVGCAQAPQPAPVAAAAPRPAVDCTLDRTLARNIMLARQLGTPMDEAMNLTHGDALVRQFVIDAYSEPHYQTFDTQSRVAEDFGDKAMLACEKGA